MSRNITAAMATALADGTLRPVMFADIEFASGTVHIWNGVGSYTFGGNVYSGAGNLVGVSEVDETNELRATGMRFRLSGVPTSYLELVLGEIEYGRDATLWLGLLNSSGALVSDPFIAFRGFVDNAQINEDGATATVTLAAEGRLISLRIARPRRLTVQDQQQVYPGDKGFDFVDGLQSRSITWGRGS